MKVLAVCIFLIAVLARQVLAENVTASVLSKKTITRNPKKSQTSAVLQKASQSPQSLTQQASASPTTQKPATIATATTANLSFPSPQLMLAPTLPTPPVLPHPNSPVPTSTSPLPLPIPNIIQSINVLNNYNQAVTVTVRYVSGLTQTYTVLPSNSMLIQNPVTVGTYTYLELINHFTFMVGTAVLGSGNNGNAMGIENRAYTITATGSLVRTA